MYTGTSKEMCGVCGVCGVWCICCQGRGTVLVGIIYVGKDGRDVGTVMLNLSELI